jgi:hypothetical protein
MARMQRDACRPRLPEETAEGSTDVNVVHTPQSLASPSLTWRRISGEPCTARTNDLLKR